MASQLSEDRRQQLDALVLRMTEAGAPDDEIGAVVEDFKTKYSAEAAEPKPARLPGERISAAPERSMLDRVGEAISQAEGVPGLAVGAGKAALETVGELGKLARYIPGVSALDRIFTPIEIDTAAANPDQEMGKRAERVGELVGAGSGVARAGRAAASRLPNAERAGQAINQAAEAARAADIAVDFAPVVDQANRIRELASRGGVMPKVVRNILQAAERGERITFDAGRDFYSNLSRLSANEFQKLTPALQRELAQLRTALGKSLEAAAEQAGKGAEYAGGLKEYGRAMKLGDKKEALWELLTKSLENTIKFGPAGAVAGKAWSALTD